MTTREGGSEGRGREEGSGSNRPGTLSSEIENRALECAKCGSCTVVCPVYRVDGRESVTARGKMFLLATVLARDPSGTFEDLFSQCLLCTACEQVCPRHLPLTDIISSVRSRFSLFYGKGGVQKVAARSLLAHPNLLEGLVKAGISLKRLQNLPVASGLRLRLGLLEERNRKQRPKKPAAARQRSGSGADATYFSGCLARHLQPSVAAATHELLQLCGLAAVEPLDQCCCGLAAWSSGKREQARSLAQKNIQAFSGSSGPIITSCASCSSHLLSYPQLFAADDPWHDRALSFVKRVQEFSSFFVAHLPVQAPAEKTATRIFFHDPCHLRFAEKGQSAPRELLRLMGMQVVEPENGPSCCGQGGLFHLGYPTTSAEIFRKAADNALASQPDWITTTCSGCLMQYQQGLAGLKSEVPVLHLALLLTKRCQ